MVLYAFDGTWNEDEATPVEDTNVKKFVDAYDGAKHYIEGVGTRFGVVGRLFGGVFGAGGQTRIEEMYDRLVAEWQANPDHPIDIIGFSRGAALAVHFANVVAEVGIQVDGVTIANPRVRFLGVWDIVGSFGIPINFVLNFQDIDVGYDLKPSDNTHHCFHAMALNERRQTFRVKRLDKGNSNGKVEERWFRGVHSDVGGGNKNTKLSNIPLKWMMAKAMECGVPIAQTDIDAIGETDKTAPLGENFDLVENAKRPVYPNDVYDESAVGKTLAVGESATFTVRAPEMYSWSGVRLAAGGHYSFTLEDGQTWCDASIKCGPDGWTSEELPWYKEAFVAHFEHQRRCPQANWFEVIGTLDEDEEDMFRISTGGANASYEAPADGELYAFANDLPSKYDNNKGTMTVTVTRLAAAAELELKGCEAV